MDRVQAERLLIDMTIMANRRICEALREGIDDIEDIPDGVIADYAPFLPRQEAEEAAQFIRDNASILKVEGKNGVEWHAGVGEYMDILLERAKLADASPEEKAKMRDQAVSWQPDAVKKGFAEIKFGSETIKATRMLYSDVVENKFHPASWDRMAGNGIGFERIRRITGYLVGSLERFNNAKRSEERDRVKHGMSQ